MVQIIVLVIINQCLVIYLEDVFILQAFAQEPYHQVVETNGTDGNEACGQFSHACGEESKKHGDHQKQRRHIGDPHGFVAHRGLEHDVHLLTELIDDERIGRDLDDLACILGHPAQSLRVTRGAGGFGDDLHGSGLRSQADDSTFVGYGFHNLKD